MSNNISTRLTDIYVVATTNGIPRPMLMTVESWADDGSVATIETEPTMEVKLTADGKKQQYALPSLTKVTINLSPISPNWKDFAQVIQEQAGYGNVFAVSSWQLTFSHQLFKLICVDGTLTEGAIVPSLSTDKLDSIAYTFQFPTSNIKRIPLI